MWGDTLSLGLQLHVAVLREAEELILLLVVDPDAAVDRLRTVHAVVHRRDRLRQRGVVALLILLDFGCVGMAS